MDKEIGKILVLAFFHGAYVVSGTNPIAPQNVPPEDSTTLSTGEVGRAAPRTLDSGRELMSGMFRPTILEKGLAEEDVKKATQLPVGAQGKSDTGNPEG